jgi:hypothetical protein
MIKHGDISSEHTPAAEDGEKAASDTLEQLSDSPTKRLSERVEVQTQLANDSPAEG